MLLCLGKKYKVRAGGIDLVGVISLYHIMWYIIDQLYPQRADVAAGLTVHQPTQVLYLILPNS